MLTLLILSLSPSRVVAQVVPDTSLGTTEQSRVTRQDASDQNASDQNASDIVTGGAMRGNRALFHSFSDFNVAEGRSLYFSPAETITHIFSRITGNNPSNIDGTLGVLGNADLFLFNPNGILFGPNAQLDLSGAFTASTAAGLQFEGFDFSATQPQAVPLLTISTPVGINVGSNPGPIINRSVANGTGLNLQPFQPLALIGGDITLDGGQITAVDGRIELTSQGDIAFVNQSTIAVNSIVGYPSNEIRLTGQNITLEGQSRLLSGNASPQAGAPIILDAQNLSLRNGSTITTVTQGAGRGGNIIANVPGRIGLTNAASNGNIGDASSIGTFTQGGAQGGDIQVQTGELLMEYNGNLTTGTEAFSAGAGGDITVNATRSVTGRYSSPTNGFGGGILLDTRGTGAGGNLSIKTPKLTLADHHNLLSVSWLDGQGGNLRVEADEIQLSNDPSIRPPITSSIRALVYGSGDGGDIDITTRDLRLDTGALIASLVEARRDDALRLARPLDPSLLELLGLTEPLTGNAGDVNIVAETIVVDGFHPDLPDGPSQISSITQGQGNAGHVTLTSRELKLLNGGGTGSSSIFAFSAEEPPADSGQGNGGTLTINADDITVAGSNHLTELSSLIGTQAGALGNAQKTEINTHRLRVLDGGLINSGTLTSGNGGDLEILAQESIWVDGQNANGQVSTIGTSALAPTPLLRETFSLPEKPSGTTNSLKITTDRLIITNSGKISSEHQGTGDAGDIEIEAKQLLLNQGHIIAETATGQGGNLTLTIQDELQLRHQSQITATALGGTGDGGNINIRAGTVFAVPQENSDIVANAQNGRGGNIQFEVGGLFGIQVQDQLTDRSDITASSQLEGFEGTVIIDLSAPNPVSGLAQFPQQLHQSQEQLSARRCRTPGSSFIVSGRGGLPLDPRYHLTRINMLEDWRTAPSTWAPAITPATSRTSPPPIARDTIQHNARVKPHRHRSISSTESSFDLNELQLNRFQEAGGWYINAKNEVQLITPATFLGRINSKLQPPCS